MYFSLFITWNAQEEVSLWSYLQPIQLHRLYTFLLSILYIFTCNILTFYDHSILSRLQNAYQFQHSRTDHHLEAHHQTQILFRCFLKEDFHYASPKLLLGLACSYNFLCPITHACARCLLSLLDHSFPLPVSIVEL
jgi:hypothetical protein